MTTGTRGARLPSRRARLGDWALASSASMNGAMGELDDHAARCARATGDARETSAAHGLTEDGGWIDYIEAEAAFATGDWRAGPGDRRARARSRRGEQLSAPDGSHACMLLIPIAGVRGDRAVLERAADVVPLIGGQVRVSRFALLAHHPCRAGPRAGGARTVAGGTCRRWSRASRRSTIRAAGHRGAAALDRVFRSWLESGEIDGAGRALDAMDGRAAAPEQRVVPGHWARTS